MQPKLKIKVAIQNRVFCALRFAHCVRSAFWNWHWVKPHLTWATRQCHGLRWSTSRRKLCVFISNTTQSTDTVFHRCIVLYWAYFVYLLSVQYQSSVYKRHGGGGAKYDKYSIDIFLKKKTHGTPSRPAQVPDDWQIQRWDSGELCGQSVSQKVHHAIDAADADVWVAPRQMIVATASLCATASAERWTPNTKNRSDARPPFNDTSVAQVARMHM